jgi:hypothetical protein
MGTASGLKAQEIIDWLLSGRRTDGGWHVSAEMDIALRELATSTGNPVSHGVLLRALDEMLASEKTNIEDFQTIASRVRSSARSSTTKQWEFFLPWSVTLEPAIGSPVAFRVLDKTLTVLLRESVEAELGAETLSATGPAAFLPYTPHDLTTRSTFLRLSQEAPSSDEAWNLLTPAFDAFRGGIECLLPASLVRAGLSQDEPRARVHHPEWMLSRADTERPKIARFLREYVRTPTDVLQISGQIVTALRTFTSLIENTPPDGSTAALVADVLRLYAQAMDASLPHLSFLGLWQVCEAIALSGRMKGDTEKVCRRLEWHATRYDFPGSGFRHALLDFAQMRNRLVHRGLRDISDSDVNDLQVIANIAVKWLRREAERLPTENALEIFYEYRTANDSKMASAEFALQYVRSERLAK